MIGINSEVRTSCALEESIIYPQMSMPQIAICLLFSGALFFVVLRILQVPLTHPINLTVFPQWFLIAYTCLDLRHHLSEFSALTWVVLFGSILAFVLGSLVAFFASNHWLKQMKHPVVELRDPWFWMWATFLLFMISCVWGVERVGGIPLFSKHPELDRADFISGVLQNILFACIIPAISFCLMGLRREASKIFKGTSLVIGTIAILSYLATGGRGLILLFLIAALVFVDTCIKPIRIRNLIPAFLVLALTFVGVGYLRYGRFSQSAEKLGWNFIIKFGLNNTYDYSGNGFWNLNYALAKMQKGSLNVPTYGASSGEGVLSLIGASGELNTAYGWDGAMNSSVVRIPGLNSTTFHWALIKDFGIAAPFYWSFFSGLLLTIIDRYGRIKSSVRASLLLGHLQYYSFIGFNIFPFIILPPIVGTGILCVALITMSHSNVSRAASISEIAGKAD
jgi:oligosaccharide repeat unit polymerase